MSAIQLHFDYTFEYQNLKDYYRPIIPVFLEYNQSYSSCIMLVDSGAVCSAISYAVAEQLGIDCSELKYHTDGKGAGGYFDYHQFDENIKLIIATPDGEDIEFESPVIITDRASSYGILGQKNFFQTFRIAFQEKNHYHFHISYD